MSIISNPDATRDGVPYVALADLRTAHLGLLKRAREVGSDGALSTELRAFLHHGRGLGTFLSDTEERWSAQSILDYWATTLYHQTQSLLDATLVEFNPQLAPILPDDACPYLGLDAFLEHDHDRFFGRQQTIAELLATLEQQRLLVIIGPSGSGKSSLALAGLLAALRQGALPDSKQWRYYPRIVPGSTPLHSLARIVQPAQQAGSTPVDSETWQQQQVPLFREDLRHLARLTGQAGTSPVTLIVDQFEEVFTLCEHVVDRRQFIANLLGMTLLRYPQHRVIFTLRSDFESYLFQFPTFEPFFRPAIVRLMPLNAAELREAIERPADQVGLKFETGLIDTLIQDILGEPAALPLLQFTLFKLWQQREHNRVTWASYRQLGGGRVALSNSADQLYQQLIPEEQETLQRLLLQMVRTGDGLEVTSSRIRREQCYQAAEDPGRVDRVLAKLMHERLIRVTEGTSAADTQVEIAHEALVRNWRLLVGWISHAREGLRQHHRLMRDAEDWNVHGRDQTLLLGETRLQEVGRLTDLNRLERDFIAASREAIRCQKEAEAQANKDRERALQRELSQQIELATERERYADARTRYAEQQIHLNRRLRSFASVLAVMTMLILVLAIFVGYLWRKAQVNEQQAQLLAMITAARYAPNPDYGLVWANLIVETDAIEKQVKSKLGNQIEELLYEMLQKSQPFIEVQPIENQRRAAPIIEDAAWDPKGTKLLTANADGIARIFDLTKAQVPVQFVHSQGLLTSAAWRPDGTQIVTTGEDGYARIWQAQGSNGLPLANFQHRQRVNAAVWSHDQRYIATASGKAVTIWDVKTNQAVHTFDGNTGEVMRIAWDPTSTALLIASADRTLRIWNVNSPILENLNPVSITGARPASGSDAVTSEARDSVTSVAWSPDGRMILLGKANSTADIWSVARQAFLVRLVGHGNSIKSVAWSPDSQSALTGSDDGTARIWDLLPVMTRPDPPDQVLTINEALVLRGGGDQISTVGWNPNQNQQEILIASGRQIHRYRIETPQELQATVSQAVQRLPKVIQIQALTQLTEEIGTVMPEAMVADIGTTIALASTAIALITPVDRATPDMTATTVVPGATATAVVPTPALPLLTPEPPPVATATPMHTDLASQLDQLFDNAGGTFNVQVVDLSSNRTIYTRNASNPLYAASLIKLPIALTLYHMAWLGDISLDERLVLQATDKVGGTGSLQGAPDGSSYALSDLAYRMLNESDNTASNMILTRITLNRVNSYMQELGATETIVERLFFDEMAIDAGKDIRTSSQDMVLLLKLLFTGSQDPQAAQLAPVTQLLDAMAHNQDAYQKIRAGLPEGTQIWNKTGVLSRMEHDAALIKMPNGHWLSIAIMSNDLPNDLAITTIVSAAKAIYEDVQNNR